VNHSHCLLSDVI